jgi:N6-adenosine-specific RNA methylase IME4
MTPGWPDRPIDLLLADPPLSFDPWGRNGSDRSPQAHYKCPSKSELGTLPISDIAAPNSVLATWSYGPRLPDTLELVAQWGFTFVSIGLVWIKISAITGRVHFGTGYYTRKASEILLLAKRGKGLPVRDHGVCEVLFAPRREHSRKPDEAYVALERLFGAARRLELFARGPARPGWTAWGDQAAPDATPVSGQVSDLSTINKETDRHEVTVR